MSTVLGPIVEYDGALPRLLADGILRNKPVAREAHAHPGIRERDQAMQPGRRFKGRDLSLRLRCGVPRGRCDEFAEGDIPLQFDAGHLTAKGSVEVGRRLAAILVGRTGEEQQCFELIAAHGRAFSARQRRWRSLAVRDRSRLGHGETRTAPRFSRLRQICRRVRQLGIRRPRTYACRPGKNGWARSPRRCWASTSMLRHLGGLFQTKLGAGHLEKAQPGAKRGLVDAADGEGNAARRCRRRLHNAAFEAAARAISEAQPNAIIRLGWEMNLFDIGVVRQGPGGRLHQGIPARGRNLQAALRRLQVRLVPGMGSAGDPRRSRLSRRRCRRLHRSRCLRLQYEGIAGGALGQIYLKGPVRSRMAEGFRRPARQTHELPGMGVGNSGDNPYFIQQMHNWFVQNERGSLTPPISTSTGCGRPRSTTASSPNRRSCSGSCSGADRTRAGLIGEAFLSPQRSGLAIRFVAWLSIFIVLLVTFVPNCISALPVDRCETSNGFA